GAPLRDVAVAPGATTEPTGSPEEAHPLLLRARSRVAAAEALVREAAAARLPRITGAGGLVEYGRGLEPHAREWQAGLEVELPLFTGGARRAGVEEARARARRAAAEADALEEALA